MKCDWGGHSRGQPHDAQVLDSGKSQLSCSLLSISELLLEQTAQQPVDCLCNGSLLSTAVFFWEWFGLGQLLTHGYWGVLAS